MLSPRIFGLNFTYAKQATRALAQEWADRKIRFNAICPVAGDTGM
jgi:NAD(P)-dependent dehydrogenase (short-subunit alcohol dehydrogenase family)